MSGWVLDTNVLSELRKRRCNPRVRNWVDSRSPGDLHVTTVTFAEIRFGINQVPDPVKRHTLSHWLDTELRPWFSERVIEIDEAVILRWREMVDHGRRNGHTFSQPDLFIAAAAAVHGHCVVTRNVGDFALAGVPVVNPWAED
ncbi:MAG: type II toxin-antitoxin system VapC family toxin [Opitutales bacterium]|nr:type II toxin-antitoxin system VapC family toxin [Opitutales bacterium]